MFAKPFTCEACDWRDLGRGYAAPDGPIDAPVWVIGESAGLNEANSGKPFQGFTGGQINKALAAAGFPRSGARCDNVVRCMPPPTPGKAKKIPKRVVDYCTSVHLTPDLQSAAPKVIIAVGEYALKYTTGRSKITANRGSIIPAPTLTTNPSVVVVPTIHYAAFAHSAGEKGGGRLNVLRPFVDYDYQRAVEAYKNGPPPIRRNYLIRPTLENIRDRIALVKARRLLCAVDIETAGGPYWDTSVLVVGVYAEDWGLSIPILGHRGERVWTKDEMVEIIALLANFLRDEDVEKVFHNGNSDIMVLESIGF